MYTRVKYINVEDNIIVFPELMQHSQFRNMGPKSAGFIAFGTDKWGNPTCGCYGESVSLGLKSDPKDTLLAIKQITLTPDND